MLSAIKATPAPVLLLVLGFLCPSELSLFIYDFRLPPHRLVLLLLLPMALVRMARSSDTRIRSFDILFLVLALWSLGVFIAHLGQAAGFKYGGSLALESLGGYVVARAWVRDAPTFRSTLQTLLLAVVAAGLIGLPEALLGQHFIHDALMGLTGYVHPTSVEQRLGLTRAYGTFDHPIHFGTFAASVLAMVWMAEAGAGKRWLKAVAVAGTTFLGLSSGPILCLALQAGMLVWERITRTMARRVSILLGAFSAFYLLVSLVATRSPIAFLATNLTLDPWTGYYRLKIWEHGFNNVLANPWTGLGLADWVRPWWMVSSSIDAFWLVLMVRQGVPAVLLLLLAIALLMRQVYKRSILTRHMDLHRLALGWMMSLIALVLVACTVHYWNVLFTYFFFVLGLGGVFADALPARAKAGAPGALPAKPAGVAGNIWQNQHIWGPPVSSR